MDALSLLMLAKFCAGVLVGLFIGFSIGKHLERVEWNKLIQEGKLPKPKSAAK